MQMERKFHLRRKHRHVKRMSWRYYVSIYNSNGRKLCLKQINTFFLTCFVQPVEKIQMKYSLFVFCFETYVFPANFISDCELIVSEPAVGYFGHRN